MLNLSFRVHPTKSSVIERVVFRRVDNALVASYYNIYSSFHWSEVLPADAVVDPSWLCVEEEERFVYMVCAAISVQNGCAVCRLAGNHGSAGSYAGWRNYYYEDCSSIPIASSYHQRTVPMSQRLGSSYPSYFGKGAIRTGFQPAFLPYQNESVTLHGAASTVTVVGADSFLLAQATAEGTFAPVQDVDLQAFPFFVALFSAPQTQRVPWESVFDVSVQVNMVPLPQLRARRASF